MKRCIVLTASAALLSIICCLMCFLAPAYARTLNTQIWTGQIDPAPEAGNSVISDILTEDGQTVLINRRDGIFRIEILLRSTVDDDVAGIVSVATDDAEWLTVVTEAENVTIPGGDEIAVTIELESLIPVEAEPEEPEEPGEPVEGGEPEEPGEEIEIPDNVTFNVTFESENITLEAVFSMETEEYDIMPSDEYSGLLDGRITETSKWYGKNIPVYVTLDGATRIKYYEGDDPPGEFPAMTKYSVDENIKVLYDGGYIIADSAGTVKIDFSDTETSGEIGFDTGSSVCLIEDEELPEWMSAFPIVLDETEKIIVNSYGMEDNAPEITVEQLVRDENGDLAWEETYLVICTENSDGAAVLNAYEAPAGTYRILFEWSYKGRPLYRMERNFFIIYSSGWQGGISR